MSSGALARWPGGLVTLAAAATERRIAWLRLPAFVLAAATHVLSDEPAGDLFVFAVVAALLYAAATLAWLTLRSASPKAGLLLTASDVAAITLLVGTSGGAFSESRWAYVLVPITAAFRLQPVLTAGAGAAAVVAFVVQAVTAGPPVEADASERVLIHSGYLIWVTVAATMLAFLLARRTARVDELLVTRRELASDAVSAEGRERRALAERLHNDAVQTLLVARHELQEAARTNAHPALARAEAAIDSTTAELRLAIFQLHPEVLEQIGLEAALRTFGEQVARRAGFRFALAAEYQAGHPHEPLLLATARELLGNVAQHAAATLVQVRVHRVGAELVLEVADDGGGFDPSALAVRLTEGHIGLASQRARVESVGGRLRVTSKPGSGTLVSVHIPL